MFRQNVIQTEGKKLELRSRAALEQSAAYADHLLSTVNAIANALSVNNDIAAYRREQSSLSRGGVIAALRQQQAFSELIANIFYLPAKDDVYFSSHSTYTRETFHRLFARAHLTPEAIAGYFAQRGMPVTAFPDTLSDRVQAPLAAQSVLSVLYPLPNGGIGKYAMLLFDIDAAKALRALGAGMTDGAIVLLDAGGGMLLSSETADLSPARIAEIRALAAAPENAPTPRDERFFLFSQPLLQGWTLAYLVPRETLTDAVNGQWMRYVLSLAALLILGVAISTALSVWNYHPIGALRKRVRAGTPAQGARFSDDLKDIENGVVDIVRQNDLLATRLVNNRQAIISRHLLNLVNSRATAEEIRFLAQDGLAMRYPNYVIVLLSPRHSTLIQREGGWIAEFQAAVPPGWDAYFMEYQVSRLYIGLFSLPPALPDALRADMEAFKQRLPAPVAVGVSAQTRDLANLAPAFIQAQLALQRRFYHGDTRVYLADSEGDRQPGAFRYPHAELHQLDMALSRKDEAACSRALDALFDSIRKSNATMEALYCVCFEVINQIIRQLAAASVPASLIEKTLPDILQITRNETLDDMRELLGDAAESALYALSSAQDTAPANFPAFQDIFAFIENNCFQSDFSVQLLSEHFGVSYPYLGRQFKACTGTTVNKYVQRLRITQARKLLVDTELALSDVVERVGYIDLSSFIKLFKQETGMTPIAYRKLYH